MVFLFEEFHTLVAAGKYGRCVQFDCSPVKGTGDVARFLVSLTEVSRPLDRPAFVSVFFYQKRGLSNEWYKKRFTTRCSLPGPV